MYRAANKSVSENPSSKTIWRCIHEKSRSCKGRLWIFEQGHHLLRQQHNHAPEPSEIASRRIISNLKEKATEGFKTPSQVIAHELNEVPAHCCSSLPSMTQLKQFVKRANANKQQKNPKHLRNLEIPPELTVDKHGNQFLQFDNGKEAGNNRMLIFAREAGLHALATSSMWLLDGTFKVAPNIFYQMYTVHVRKNGTCAPVLYCLLPSKKKSLYSTLCSEIKKLVPFACVTVINVDFEMAFISAFQTHFPHVACSRLFFPLQPSTLENFATLP